MKKIASRPVTCDVKNKDMYGRSVSVCYVGGAAGIGREDLNAWLVSQGDAVAYEQYSKEYVPLEQQARAERKVRTGLWLRVTPVQYHICSCVHACPACKHCRCVACVLQAWRLGCAAQEVL